MPTITYESFDKFFETRRPNKNIVKWRDLEKEILYTVVGKKTIKTKNGDATVLILEDGVEVWACSTFVKRLEEDEDKSFPCYFRTKGKVQSKLNTSYQYFGFDLVWSEDFDNEQETLEKEPSADERVRPVPAPRKKEPSADERVRPVPAPRLSKAMPLDKNE